MLHHFFMRRPSYFCRYTLLGSVLALILFCTILTTLTPSALATPAQKAPSRLEEVSTDTQGFSLEQSVPSVQTAIPFLQYTIDTEHELSLQELLSPSYQAAFRPLSEGFPLNVSGTTWLRLSLASFPAHANGYPLVLDLGYMFPGTARVYTPLFSDKAVPPTWIENHATEGNITILPNVYGTETPIYIQLEDIPNHWFAPQLKTVLTAASSLEAFLHPATLLILGVVLLLCLLRGITEKGEWRIWTALFTGAALFQGLWGQPSTPYGSVALVSLPGVLAPGIALMLLPHVARHMLATPQKALRLDKHYILLSLTGAFVALAPLVPGMAWLTRWIPLWPLACIAFIPTTLMAVRQHLPGAKRFLLGCTMSMSGAALSIFAMQPLGSAATEVTWLSSLIAIAPLAGVALGALLIAGTSITNQGNHTAAAFDTLPSEQRHPAAYREDIMNPLEGEPGLRLLSREEIEKEHVGIPIVMTPDSLPPRNASMHSDGLESITEAITSSLGQLPEYASVRAQAEQAEQAEQKIGHSQGGQSPSTLGARHTQYEFDESVEMTGTPAPILKKQKDTKQGTSLLAEEDQENTLGAIDDSSSLHRKSEDLAPEEIPSAIPSFEAQPSPIVSIKKDIADGAMLDARIPKGCTPSYANTVESHKDYSYVGEPTPMVSPDRTTTVTTPPTHATLGDEAHQSLPTAPLPAPSLIIIGSDIPSSRRMLVSYLVETEYDVATACNPSEVVMVYRQQPAGIVLFDGDMPEDSIILAIAAIRDYEGVYELPPAPMLALVNHEEQALRLLQAGCNEALEKPVTQQELRDLLHDLLPLSGLRTSTAALYHASNSHMALPTRATNTHAEDMSEQQKESAAPAFEKRQNSPLSDEALSGTITRVANTASATINSTEEESNHAVLPSQSAPVPSHNEVTVADVTSNENAFAQDHSEQKSPRSELVINKKSPSFQHGVIPNQAEDLPAVSAVSSDEMQSSLTNDTTDEESTPEEHIKHNEGVFAETLSGTVPNIELRNDNAEAHYAHIFEKNDEREESQNDSWQRASATTLPDAPSNEDKSFYSPEDYTSLAATPTEKTPSDDAATYYEEPQEEHMTYSEAAPLGETPLAYGEVIHEEPSEAEAFALRVFSEHMEQRHLSQNDTVLQLDPILFMDIEAHPDAVAPNTKPPHDAAVAPHNERKQKSTSDTAPADGTIVLDTPITVSTAPSSTILPEEQQEGQKNQDDSLHTHLRHEELSPDEYVEVNHPKQDEHARAEQAVIQQNSPEQCSAQQVESVEQREQQTRVLHAFERAAEHNIPEATLPAFSENHSTPYQEASLPFDGQSHHTAQYGEESQSYDAIHAMSAPPHENYEQVARQDSSSQHSLIETQAEHSVEHGVEHSVEHGVEQESFILQQEDATPATPVAPHQERVTFVTDKEDAPQQEEANIPSLQSVQSSQHKYMAEHITQDEAVEEETSEAVERTSARLSAVYAKLGEAIPLRLEESIFPLIPRLEKLARAQRNKEEADSDTQPDALTPLDVPAKDTTELVVVLQTTLAEALIGREQDDIHAIYEASIHIANNAAAFGLRILERIARCVERAATANDMDAVRELLPDLQNAVHRDIARLQEDSYRL